MANYMKKEQKSREGIIITAKCGKIRGIAATSKFSGKTYDSFLGIPYAIPPLGHLRFEPPVPIPRFHNVFTADTEKECIQYSLFEHMLVGTEDCLYLNVHIPEVPSKEKPLLPVVVNIHFGGFLWGSGSTSCCGSADFVMHCGIVYVTVTFRLHVFGFLCLNTPECSGNMGLKDIVLALRWVQRNIKYFGGDPNNVTLLGSSSGSMQIHQLMMIPSSKGLFHKVILMGMYGPHPFFHYPLDPVEQAYKLARAMNFTGQSLFELYNFLKYSPTVLFLNPLRETDLHLGQRKKKIIISSPFLPVYGSVDGFLPKMPENMTKIVNSVPLIFGICDNEITALFLTKYRKFFYQDFHQVFRQSCYLWTHRLNKNEMRQIEDEVRKKYGNNEILMPSRATTDLAAMEFYHTLGDILEDVNPDIPQYIYKFQYESTLNGATNFVRSKNEEKIEGSFHADDIFYWMYRDHPLNETDKYLVELITKLFCNFARTGDPNEPNESVLWNASTKENPCHLSITGEKGTTELRNERLNADGIVFWENLKKKFAKNIIST